MLQVGDTEYLTVTETTTKEDGTVTEKDVTTDATFSSADESIATVETGTITAVEVGTTAITVSYNDFSHVIVVEVLEGTVEEDGKYVVPDSDIANQVNDKNAKEVVLSLPNLEGDSLNVEFNNPILNTLVQSKKDFILQSENTSYIFSKKAVEKLAKRCLTYSQSNSRVDPATISFR